MGQIKGLLRETWYVWILFLALAIGMGVLSNIIFLGMIPGLVVVFFYFAFVRYDENGQVKKKYE
jgi:hypothetical protein